MSSRSRDCALTSRGRLERRLDRGGCRRRRPFSVAELLVRNCWLPPLVPVGRKASKVSWKQGNQSWSPVPASCAMDMCSSNRNTRDCGSIARTAGWRLCFVLPRTSPRASPTRRHRNQHGSLRQAREGVWRGLSPGRASQPGTVARICAGHEEGGPAKFFPFPSPRIDIAGFVGTLCLG